MELYRTAVTSATFYLELKSHDKEQRDSSSRYVYCFDDILIPIYIVYRRYIDSNADFVRFNKEWH